MSQSFIWNVGVSGDWASANWNGETIASSGTAQAIVDGAGSDIVLSDAEALTVGTVTLASGTINF